MTTHRHVRAAAFGCLASIALISCGTATEVAVNTRSVDSASEQTDGQPMVNAFLRDANDQLVAACNKVLSTIPQGRPPTTLDTIVVNGFVPIVGPTCNTGYAMDRPPLDGSGNVELPAGLAVRAKPEADSPIVGYVIPGTPGWVSTQQIADAHLTIEEILSDRT